MTRTDQAVRLTAEAFAERLRGSSARLWCVAVAVLGDRTEAEDVLQDAAMVALGKLDDYESGTNFDAWMGQIVRYTALNRARKRNRRATRAEDPVVLDASNASGARSGSGGGPVVSSDGKVMAGQAGFDDEIVGALGSLSVDARACFLLRVVEGLPYKEISRSLDIPEGTAMGHVHRVRRALREQLGGEKGGRA